MSDDLISSSYRTYTQYMWFIGHQSHLKKSSKQIHGPFPSPPPTRSTDFVCKCIPTTQYYGIISKRTYVVYGNLIYLRPFEKLLFLHTNTYDYKRVGCNNVSFFKNDYSFRGKHDFELVLLIFVRIKCACIGEFDVIWIFIGTTTYQGVSNNWSVIKNTQPVKKGLYYK